MSPTHSLSEFSVDFLQKLTKYCKNSAFSKSPTMLRIVKRLGGCAIRLKTQERNRTALDSPNPNISAYLFSDTVSSTVLPWVLAHYLALTDCLSALRYDTGKDSNLA